MQGDGHAFRNDAIKAVHGKIRLQRQKRVALFQKGIADNGNQLIRAVTGSDVLHGNLIVVGKGFAYLGGKGVGVAVQHQLRRNVSKLLPKILRQAKKGLVGVQPDGIFPGNGVIGL